MRDETSLHCSYFYRDSRNALSNSLQRQLATFTTFTDYGLETTFNHFGFMVLLPALDKMHKVCLSYLRVPLSLFLHASLSVCGWVHEGLWVGVRSDSRELASLFSGQPERLCSSCLCVHMCVCVCERCGEALNHFPTAASSALRHSASLLQERSQAGTRRGTPSPHGRDALQHAF